MRRLSQRGFSLVAAMFIVVVLALLGAFMVNLSGTQHTTAADAVTGARAYYAARSGAEWGGAQAALTGSCAALAAPGFPAYLEFAVTVTCTNGGTTHTEAGVTYSVFQISATATSNGIALGNPGYVSRTVRLVVTDGP